MKIIATFIGKTSSLELILKDGLYEVVRVRLNGERYAICTSIDYTKAKAEFQAEVFDSCIVVS